MDDQPGWNTTGSRKGIAGLQTSGVKGDSRTAPPTARFSTHRTLTGPRGETNLGRGRGAGAAAHHGTPGARQGRSTRPSAGSAGREARGDHRTGDQLHTTRARARENQPGRGVRENQPGRGAGGTGRGARGGNRAGEQKRLETRGLRTSCTACALPLFVSPTLYTPEPPSAPERIQVGFGDGLGAEAGKTPQKNVTGYGLKTSVHEIPFVSVRRARTDGSGSWVPSTPGGACRSGPQKN
jgi:hypothetical protein